MISFKPWVGKAKTGLTSGGFIVIIPFTYLFVLIGCLESSIPFKLGSSKCVNFVKATKNLNKIYLFDISL